MDSKLLLIEFHDGTFSEIRVDSSFVASIVFSEIVCYYANDDPKLADLWLCPAVVTVEGAKQLTINSPMPSAKNVSDFEFEIVDQQFVDRYNLSLLKGQLIKSACLQLAGPASICIEGGTAKLSLGERLTFLEQVDWTEFC